MEARLPDGDRTSTGAENMKIQKCEKCAMDVSPGWFFAADGCALSGCPVKARHDELAELEFGDFGRWPGGSVIAWPLAAALFVFVAAVFYLIGRAIL